MDCLSRNWAEGGPQRCSVYHKSKKAPCQNQLDPSCRFDRTATYDRHRQTANRPTALSAIVTSRG